VEEGRHPRLQHRSLVDSWKDSERVSKILFPNCRQSHCFAISLSVSQSIADFDHPSSIRKNYYKENGVVYPQFDAAEAFKRAMRTWGKWIDENIDHRKSLVFYRGYSAAHFRYILSLLLKLRNREPNLMCTVFCLTARGGDWDSGGTCNGETEPALSGAIIDSYPSKMKIMEEVIAGMKSPVVLLNVTKLTNFRKDGHPSIYGTSVKPGQKVSRRKQDCSHWCLPGVPDAWNELIYATLVLDQYRV